MKILIHTKFAFSKARLAYVLDFIEDHPASQGQLEFTLNQDDAFDKSIAYGHKGIGDFYIPAQFSFFSSTIHSTSLFSPSTYKHGDLNIYSVEKSTQKNVEFYEDGSFGFDLFECIFFHISRYEEYFPQKESLNELSMMKNSELFLPKHGLEKIAVVDHLIYAFCLRLGIEDNALKTVYALSHDIDKIYKFNSGLDAIKAFAWPIVYKFNFVWAFRNIVRYFKVLAKASNDPYDSYHFLFSDSGEWEQKEVYFMAGGKSNYDLYDKYYERDFPSIWKKAKDQAYKIGLHPSFNCADDAELMREEKEKLELVSGETVTLNRQHFLHYHFGQTDKAILESSFNKDATLGYSRLIGFRCGTGFKYKLYDFKNRKAFDFDEDPLVVMDSSLIHECRDDMDKFENYLFDFLSKNKYLTRITFNFHNSSFDDTLEHRKELKKIYLRLINRIEKGNEI